MVTITQIGDLRDLGVTHQTLLVPAAVANTRIKSIVIRLRTYMNGDGIEANVR